jgi:hypothetical protein
MITTSTGEPMSAKAAVRKTAVRVLSKPIAAWEYAFKPELRDPFGGPFNGQRGRQAIFNEIVRLLDVKGVIETGTFRGTTTEFMAQQDGAPIWTVEARPRYYYYAVMRLRRFSQVHISLGDSRTFLKRLVTSNEVPKSRAFFYLDAHWYDDLPLKDEIEIITRHWSNFAIMIDDFEVPGDAGYKFDDYGNGKRLALSYLGPLSTLGLQAFFPRIASGDETGMLRGSVVLTDADGAYSLAGASTLRAAR